MIKRLATTAALLAAAATVVLLGGGAHGARPFMQQAVVYRQTVPPDKPQVPADSVRRGPFSAEDSARALEKLSNDIAAIVNLPKEVKAGRVGVEVRSLTANKLLYTMNADKPLTPASNTKLVTTFTALSELGPNYVVRTVVAADAKPGHDGVVKGNLYVKGYGDPFLSVNEIDALIDQLVNSGIHEIDGNIVGDGSFFDNKTERTQYSGDADVVEQLPPIAALTISQSVFTVVVSSPRTPGEPCNVQTFPHSSGFEIVNDAVAATPRSARASSRKAASGKSSARKGATAKPSSRKGKRHSALIPDGDDDAGGPRFGDEPASNYPTVLGQKKPAKKAVATVAKHGTPVAHKAAPATKRVASAKAGASTKSGTPAKHVAAAKPSVAKSRSSKTKAAAPAKTTRTATRVAKATRPAVKADVAKADPPAHEATPAPVVVNRGALKVSVSTGENGKQIVTVTGSMAANRTVSYRYQMKNAPMVIAGMVYDRLRSHGITISGQPVSGVSPAKSRVLAETGRPLVEILHLVMKNSNNFLAEYVFKMIGAAAGGQQETAQKSIEKIQHRMTINHVNFSRCVINDGSGLSRANCLSASSLVGILNAAYNDKKVFDALYGLMSIAGVDGTLRGRMRGTYAQGNVHGKTGTLNNVSALTGYVTTRDGELLCFAMLMNGGGSYHSVQDRVAARLAAFSYGETLTALSNANAAAK